MREPSGLQTASRSCEPGEREMFTTGPLSAGREKMSPRTTASRRFPSGERLTPDGLRPVLRYSVRLHTLSSASRMETFSAAPLRTSYL